MFARAMDTLKGLYKQVIPRLILAIDQDLELSHLSYVAHLVITR